MIGLFLLSTTYAMDAGQQELTFGEKVLQTLGQKGRDDAIAYANAKQQQKKDHITEARESQRRAEAEKRDLERTCFGLDQRIKGLEAQLEEVSTLRDSHAALQETETALRTELGRLTAAEEGHVRAVSDPEGSVRAVSREKDEIQEELAQLRRTHDELLAEHEGCEGRIKAAKEEGMEEAIQLQDGANTMTAEQAAEEKGVLEKEITALREKLSEAGTALQELETLRTQAEADKQLRAEFEKLKETMNQHEAEARDLKKDNENKVQEISELRELLAQLAKETRTLKAEPIVEPVNPDSLSGSDSEGVGRAVSSPNRDGEPASQQTPQVDLLATTEVGTPPAHSPQQGEGDRNIQDLLASVEHSSDGQQHGDHEPQTAGGLNTFAAPFAPATTQSAVVHQDPTLADNRATSPQTKQQQKHRLVLDVSKDRKQGEGNTDEAGSATEARDTVRPAPKPKPKAKNGDKARRDQQDISVKHSGGTPKKSTTTRRGW